MECKVSKDLHSLKMYTVHVTNGEANKLVSLPNDRVTQHTKDHTERVEMLDLNGCFFNGYSEINPSFMFVLLFLVFVTEVGEVCVLYIIVYTVIL